MHHQLLYDTLRFPPIRQTVGDTGTQFQDGSLRRQAPGGLAFEFARSPSKFPDFAGSDTGVPILSPDFRRFLDEHGVDNVQYFPCTLSDPVSDDRRDYLAANVIGLIGPPADDPADLIPAAGDTPTPFAPIRMENTHCEALPLFRLATDKTVLLMQERLLAAARGVGLSGFAFQSDDDREG